MKNIDHLKQKLEAEKAALEKDLATVGRKNPSNASDWEATPSDKDTTPSDPDERAEKIESFEENEAIVSKLEIGLGEVTATLERIKNNIYGVCNVCKNPIEEARLEANPAAATCKAHLN